MPHNYQSWNESLFYDYFAQLSLPNLRFCLYRLWWCWWHREMAGKLHLQITLQPPFVFSAWISWAGSGQVTERRERLAGWVSCQCATAFFGPEFAATPFWEFLLKAMAILNLSSCKTALNQFYISRYQYCATASYSIDREVCVSMVLLFRSWEEGGKWVQVLTEQVLGSVGKAEEIPAEFLAFSSFHKFSAQDLMMTWNIWTFMEQQQLQALWKGFLTFFPPFM